MKRYCAIIILLLSAIACEPTELPSNTDSMTRIPLDEAIETLNNTLLAIHPLTKTTGELEIDEILTISKNTIIDGAPNEDLAYVVNYTNDKGFALLSADRNLPDPIIAILENGTMDQNMTIHYEVKTKSDSSQDTISAFIGSLLNNYILNEGGGGNGDDDEEHDDENPEGDDPGTLWNPGMTTWVPYSVVAPMVPLLWDQIKSPFNDNYPLHNGHPRNAGCVPLAISMILAYHHRPANLVIDNNPIDWDLVNEVERYDSTIGQTTNGHPLGKADVSDLIYSVGLGCNMSYIPFTSYTFAWPDDARDFLYSMGFTNATNHTSYDLDLIIDMLEENNPVFIASISGFANGHAWLIDGMIRLQNGYGTRDLLHCNMGFGGIANGYYASRVFKSSKQIYLDSNYGDQEPDEDHTFSFNKFFRIITY